MSSPTFLICGNNKQRGRSALGWIGGYLEQPWKIMSMAHRLDPCVIVTGIWDQICQPPKRLKMLVINRVFKCFDDIADHCCLEEEARMTEPARRRVWRRRVKVAPANVVAVVRE
jgi:hypothetical protein